MLSTLVCAGLGVTVPLTSFLCFSEPLECSTLPLVNFSHSRRLCFSASQSWGVVGMTPFPWELLLGVAGGEGVLLPSPSLAFLRAISSHFPLCIEDISFATFSSPYSPEATSIAVNRKQSMCNLHLHNRYVYKSINKCIFTVCILINFTFI